MRVQNLLDRVWERYDLRITNAEVGFARHAIARAEPFALRLGPDAIAPGGRATFAVAVRLRCRWVAFMATPAGRILRVLPEATLTWHKQALVARKKELRAAGLETKPAPAPPTKQASPGG